MPHRFGTLTAAAAGLALTAGCDGGTVVIADNSRPAPYQAAPPAAPRADPRPQAPRDAAPRREPRPPAMRSGDADRRGFAPPADDRRDESRPDDPAPGYVDGPGEVEPADPAAEAAARADRIARGGSAFGAPAALTTAEALQVLNGPADVFERADALKALAAAPVEEARRGEVNALLTRTLAGALEGSGTAAADHIAAMMHWAGEPAAFRKIGEAAVLGSGPWASREVLRRASLAEDPAAVHALTPLLRDRWVGREAVEAVRRLGEQAEPAVLPLLADGDPTVRRDAATLLGATGGPDAAEALLKRAGVESDGGLARHMRSVRTEILRRLRASGR